MSMKVFFHTRSPQERGWSNNEKRELARIPILGEGVRRNCDLQSLVLCSASGSHAF